MGHTAFTTELRLAVHNGLVSCKNSRDYTRSGEIPQRRLTKISTLVAPNLGYYDIVVFIASTEECSSQVISCYDGQKVNVAHDAR